MTNFTLTFLTYNRLNVVIKCFNSFKFTLNNSSVQWKILDNASDENTVRYLMKLHEQYPNQIEIYLSTTNLGVAGGRKKLLEMCDKTDVIGFLDSDTECFDTNFLTKIENLLSKKEIGLIGQSGHAITRDWRTKPYSEDYEGPVDTCSGFCQFFKQRNIKRHHIDLDLNFNYAGAEDDDFCFQFRNANFQIWKTDLGISHHFSGTWNTSGYRDNQLKLKEKWEKKQYLFRML